MRERKVELGPIGGGRGLWVEWGRREGPKSGRGW